MTNQERMERIELPDELEQVILKAVDQGRKKKNRMTWKRVGFGCAGVAAAFAVLVSAGFVNPVAARAFEGMPAVGKVFTYLYDLAGYEGRYAQVAEDARPAAPPQQKEAHSREGVQIAVGQQETEAQQGMTGVQGTTDQQGRAGRQGTIVPQEAVTASDAGITITVREYFCDKKSLYLSMVIEGEEPFFEDGVEENTEGSVFLFTGEETLSYEGGDPVCVENSDGLLLDGVYLDDHTFVGIARSEWRNVKKDNIDIPDELTYTALTRHLKFYLQDGPLDFRGEWEFSMELLCEEEAVEVLPVEVTGEDGSIIREVRFQPYEIQVATESKKSGITLTEEKKMLIAFDENGNLLDWAGSAMSFQENGKEIFGFARPENLGGLELFIVDESCWMDQWKGNLYDGTMTGSDMVEFLKDHCLAYGFVRCEKVF